MHMSQVDGGAERTVWKIQNAEFDPVAWQISVDGEEVEAQDYPKKVLRYFVENADRVVTKDELIENTAQQRCVSDGAVTNVISKLRAALGPEASQCLKTVRGRGYRLENVTQVSTQSPARPVEDDTSLMPPQPIQAPSPKPRSEQIQNSDKIRWLRGCVSSLILALIVATICIWYAIRTPASQEQLSGRVQSARDREVPQLPTPHAGHSPPSKQSLPASDWLIAAASRIEPNSHAGTLALEYYRKGVHAYLNQQFRTAHTRFKISKALIRNQQDAADQYALAYAGDIAALAASGQSSTALALLHSFPATDASAESSRLSARISYWFNTLYQHPPDEIADRMRHLAQAAVKRFGRISPEYWATQAGLAMNEARNEQWSLAYHNLTDSYDHLASFGDQTFWRSEQITPALAKAAAHTGRCDMALPRLRESSQRIPSEAKTVESPMWANTQFAMARCLARLHKYGDAKGAINAVLTLYEALANDSEIAKRARWWRSRIARMETQ